MGIGYSMPLNGLGDHRYRRHVQYSPKWIIRSTLLLAACASLLAMAFDLDNGRYAFASLSTKYEPPDLCPDTAIYSCHHY